MSFKFPSLGPSHKTCAAPPLSSFITSIESRVTRSFWARLDELEMEACRRSSTRGFKLSRNRVASLTVRGPLVLLGVPSRSVAEVIFARTITPRVRWSLRGGIRTDSSIPGMGGFWFNRDCPNLPMSLRNPAWWPWNGETPLVG